MTGKPFTQEEVDFLRRNSADMTTSELAKRLDRPCISVAQKVKTMGLPRKVGAQGPYGNKWKGCDKTCPDYCPYPDCRMPAYEAAINYREDFHFKEFFDDPKLKQ